MDRFGFVIIRNVINEKTNEYWKESVRLIRFHYPEYKILIVDDQSDPFFLKYEEDEIKNCIIVQSEYPKRGELLGYYYFYTMKLFQKAVILHDSVFIQKRIDFENIDKIQFLWTFQHFQYPGEKKLLQYLKNSDKLLVFYENFHLWNGCFGVMSVISYSFLQTLQEEYDFFHLLNFVVCREDRSMLERVFGIICSMKSYELSQKCSLFGNIYEYIRWGYSFDEYKMDQENKILDNYPIIKVWTGR